MTEILVSDGQFFGASTIGGRFYWSLVNLISGLTTLPYDIRIIK